VALNLAVWFGLHVIIQVTYPRDRAPAAKNIFDKALARPQGAEFEDYIENREGTYPGH
jgi:hypothetical protein